MAGWERIDPPIRPFYLYQHLVRTLGSFARMDPGRAGKGSESQTPFSGWIPTFLKLNDPAAKVLVLTLTKISSAPAIFTILGARFTEGPIAVKAGYAVLPTFPTWAWRRVRAGFL
jgi:hypothetical protein